MPKHLRMKSVPSSGLSSPSASAALMASVDQNRSAQRPGEFSMSHRQIIHVSRRKVYQPFPARSVPGNQLAHEGNPVLRLLTIAPSGGVLNGKTTSGAEF